MMSENDLALDPLTADSWRLCNRTVAPSDAGSLVAYVERRDDARYAVTWVIGPHTPLGGSTVYDSLGGVLRDAVDRVEARTKMRRPTRATAASKPVPIAHRPPLAAL